MTKRKRSNPSFPLNLAGSTGVACVAVALTTYWCFHFHLSLTIASFLYLIVVVLQSLRGSFAASALVSVVTVACLDFFFTEPLFSFEVTNSLDILALASYLITSLVITQLITRAAAAQAEIFRTAILDALAHEFKTPLATILTAAGALCEMQPLLSPHQQELAQLIESETSRLNELTSQILRTSRLDRKAVKPRLRRTEVADLVGKLVAQYSRRYPGRTFSLSTKGMTAQVLADYDLLELAVKQLLDNACKYSPATAEVEIRIDTDGKDATVRVLNDGIAIPLEERARIFNRFYRGSVGEQVAPGTGLGLYFAHEIVKAHGGRMELESRAAVWSKDTSFRVTLPLAEPQF
ncbi:MAG TPA: ATP-binding protein [Candidatus Sulfotelmatobacter sp.]|nr:ATP-binding protein [Candidatus Sulfotelmatobacter sp.]